MRTWWWLTAALVACGGVPPVVEDEETEDRRPVPLDTTPVVMPDFPAAVAGQLTLQSNARQEEHRFAGHWPAVVGVCHEPTVIQLVAMSDSLGTIFFVGPGPDSALVGEYQVVEGRQGLPDTATARVGLHTFGRGRPRGFRAIAGMVEVQRADSVLSGRFTAEFTEERTRDSILVAATFEAVLEDAPTDWCLVFDWEDELTAAARPMERAR